MTSRVAIDPSRPDCVGPALLEYLTGQLGVSELGFAEPPEQISVGWETYIYALRLTGDGLDPAWARPLILRIYPGADQGPRAEQEAAVQRFAVERGYPAPHPLAVETTADALGRPFMIMERASGVAMLERMAGHPVAAFRFAALMADTHVALHRLPVEGCPLPSEGALVERCLAYFRQVIADCGLQLSDEAEEALNWLDARKGAVIPEDASFCHNDFHPLNIMVDEDRRITVVDWPGAALGDRHHDIASTLVLLRTAPVEASNLVERLMVRFGRGLFVWLYLRRYRQQLSIDPERLRYWEALRAFEWWVMVTAIQSPSPAAVGVKPDTAQRIPAGHLALLRSYFWQRARR